MKLRNFIITFSLALSPSTFAAIYTAPAGGEIESPVSFEVPTPHVTRTGSLTTIHYKLPSDLVGPGFPSLQMHTHEYALQTFSIQSEFGQGECSRSMKAIHCNLKMRNLNVDTERAAAFIRSRHGNSMLAENKIKLMRHFNGDPVGVLSY